MTFKNDKCINLSIKPSFFLFIFLIAFLGYGYEFLIIFSIVTVHELCHVCMGTYLRLDFRYIEISLVGEKSFFSGIEKLKSYEKILLYLSGPLSNILWALLLLMFSNDDFKFLINVNLIVATINLLPIFPLDGANIYHLILGNKIGIINSAKLLTLSTKVISYFSLVIGFLILLINPFNITILLLSLYLLKTNKYLYISLINNFYKDMYIKYANKKKLEIKFMDYDEDEKINIILEKLTWDSYYYVRLNNTDNYVSEEYILNKILSYKK